MGPLIPKPKIDREKQYERDVGGGSKPLDSRAVFSAIVYVLRTGIQWKALPIGLYVSPSAVHRYFRAWEQAVFSWSFGREACQSKTIGRNRLGMAIHRRQHEQGPFGPRKLRAQPYGSGGKRNKAPYPRGRAWHPVVNRRERG